jgi:hypothetical protein
MNEKEVLAEVEKRGSRQSSLLSAFEEIAQTFLSLVSGEWQNRKVFASLQDYLDGSVVIDGAYCRRRTVLLAIHDLKEEINAPSTLQSKTRAKLDLLHIRPMPEVTLYQDIATAILRMEVVIRFEAVQARNDSASGASGSPVRVLGWKRLGAMPKLKTFGYGLITAGCCAGAFMFLPTVQVGVRHTSVPAQLAAKGAEALTNARGCTSNSDAGNEADGGACALGTSLPYVQRKVLSGNAFSAAEFAMYSPLSEGGLGSAFAVSSSNAPSVRETPKQPSWATSVESN